MTLAVVGSDAYKWMLGLHILAAVIWIGSNFAIQFFAIHAKSVSPQRMGDFADDIAWYGQRFLVPASFLLMVLGFGLIHESKGAYDLGQGWLGFAFGIWFLSFIAGAGYLGPESERLSKLQQERGPDDPGYKRRLGRIFLVSRIELVLLIAVVLDMTIKPGL